MTMAAGVGALEDEAYTRANCRTVMENRAWTVAELKTLGFTMPDSMTNFIFAKHTAIDGDTIYRELRARGILVRHFSLEKIKDYNRITVGSIEQMQALVHALKEITGGCQ